MAKLSSAVSEPTAQPNARCWPCACPEALKLIASSARPNTSGGRRRFFRSG